MVSLVTISTVAEIGEYVSVHPTGELSDSEIDGQISHWHKFCAGLYEVQRKKKESPKTQRESNRLHYYGGITAFLGLCLEGAHYLLANPPAPVSTALATTGAGLFIYGMIVRKRENLNENTLHELVDEAKKRIVALEGEQQKRAFGP